MERDIPKFDRTLAQQLEESENTSHKHQSIEDLLQTEASKEVDSYQPVLY